MAIPELSTLSKKTQDVVKMIMFENFSVDWPMLVKHSRSRMKEDLNAVGGTDVATYHPNLAALFNYYLKGKVLEANSDVLNEIWRVLFSKEYNRMQMKKLEKEIDMSDVQTVPFDSIFNVFKPYGMAICLEKSNTIRIQPWVPDKFGQRYYSRASQAKAIIKLRMLNRWHISLDDAHNALTIFTQKNPERGDCLKIDLTKC